MSKQKTKSATTTITVAAVEQVKIAEDKTSQQRYQQLVEDNTPQQPCQKHGGVSFEEAVKVRAYQLWERAGRPAGDGTSFWLEAESEMRACK